ncbi:MAG: hypothetical protein H0T79_07630 [Deltaproteobacteria bacterium]|nr:hypothetical protein [Deltaproteobacteria bacterium]
MRISWLSPAEIAVARQALTADGATWDDHFTPTFVAPSIPPGTGLLDWERVTEHVARAERVSAVVRESGLEAAHARFGDSGIAIEAATLAAAAHENESLELEQVLFVLRCAIDEYVFYAHFLELLMTLGKTQLDRVVVAYEAFVVAHTNALSDAHYGHLRINAVRDGLADVYVGVGRFDDAQTLFERRHEEDQNDVAVALSASRAFLAAGSVSHAVRWLGIGATRATVLGRDTLAKRLSEKQDNVRKRLS